MIKIMFLCIMIYFIVMWAFMMGDTLTGYSIPWLDKMASIGIVILLIFVIAFFSVFTYGVVTDDPSVVEAMK